MNVFERPFVASLTDSIGAFDNLFQCFLPSNSISYSRDSPLPSRVRFSNSKFRLPFCHTFITAKSAFSMEVRYGARNVFPTPVARARFNIRSAGVGLPGLGGYSAFKRTESLMPLPCAYGRFTTMLAERRFLFPPARIEIARGRTKTLIRASIERVKWLSAIDAIPCLGFLFHIPILSDIEIEERYCEIAARRLAQAVLPLPAEPAPLQARLEDVG